MNGWIGVDLDGTLAEYIEWQGETHIGKPIPLMINRVKQWISSGKTVKIFTARAYCSTGLIIEIIEEWCKEHIGVVLPVTCMKDYGMIELWDDRAVQVIPNKGIPLQDLLLLKGSDM